MLAFFVLLGLVSLAPSAAQTSQCKPLFDGSGSGWPAPNTLAWNNHCKQELGGEQQNSPHAGDATITLPAAVRPFNPGDPFNACAFTSATTCGGDAPMMMQDIAAIEFDVVVVAGSCAQDFAAF